MGLFGGHRFYLGRGGSGASMAILTIPGNATAVLFIGIAFLLAVAVRSVMGAFLIPGWIELPPVSVACRSPRKSP